MTTARVMPLGPDAALLQVLIAPVDAAADAALEARIDAHWADLCTRHRRLFDGSILAFVAYDPAANVVHARAESFKRLAVQPEIHTGVTQLGVTGLFVAGTDDDRRVLLGRRGRDTLLYPGRWELAPSGGLDVPQSVSCVLNVDDLCRQMQREVHEELAIETRDLRIVPIALCHDPDAPSMDVVFLIRPEADVHPTAHGWEYECLRWVPICRLDRAMAELDLIEPSRAVLEWAIDPAGGAPI